MGLKDLDKKIKISYTQGWDNPIEDFLIPCLTQSIEFDVISGYFSSYILIPLFYGLKKFIIENKGTIKLIAGVIFREDLSIINLKKSELEDIIGKRFYPDFFEKEKLDYRIKEHLKLLAWLLANDRLKIKLGIPIDEKGMTIPMGQSHAILHEKIGVLKDNQGDFITFSGSTNATFAGWALERDEFKVFKSWNFTKSYALTDLNKFNIYWNDDDVLLKVIKFPNDLIRNVIEKYSVETIEDINFDIINNIAEEELQNSVISLFSKKLSDESEWKVKRRCIIPYVETLNPYDFQEEAIEHLRKNDYYSFLNMATGSGKTCVAIFASYKLYKYLNKNQKQLLIVIGVPDSYLVKQWGNILKNLSNMVIQCSSDKENRNWKSKASDALQMLNTGILSHYIFIGTYDSLNQIFWEEYLHKFENENKSILFIADEAHALGAPQGRILLESINPKYRIGLSATPYRYFDDEGTIFLLNWFLNTNSKMFTYSLKQAQEEGKLLKYNYHIQTCNLDNNSFENFVNLSKSISRMPENDEEQAKRKQLKFFERANLLKKSENKIQVLEEILKNMHTNNNLKKTIIYCKDNEHIHSVENIIRQINYEFDTSNTKLKSTKIQRTKSIIYQIISGEDDINLREKKISKLKKDNINLLIAMKCLDQGVDIPCLTNAIFLSSSGSELEHIQRAGRLVRKSPSKPEIVNIYDIIILPSDSQLIFDKENGTNYCVKIFNMEEKRIEFFSELAQNSTEVKYRLQKWKNQYFWSY